MLERRRERTHIRWLDAALCLLLIFGNSEAMVLCVGHDGHVAIEASDSACCGHLPWVVSERSILTFGAAGPSAEDDDCGPCLDIPISSGLAEAVAVRHVMQPDLPVSIELEPLLVTRPCFSQVPLDLKFLIPPSCFTPSDAIVLLI
jgi:hypothetical protein